MARTATTTCVLALTLCLVGPAHAQVSPNVTVPETAAGNQSEGTGDAGGGITPKPRPTAAPKLVPRTTPVPVPTATAPPPRRPSTVRPAPKVSSAARERAAAAARERRRLRAARRAAAQRDRRFRTTVLRRTNCLKDVADVDRSVVLLRAHPSGSAPRPRARVATLLAISVRGVKRSEAHALQRFRTLEREGSCAAVKGDIPGPMLAHAKALERAALRDAGSQAAAGSRKRDPKPTPAATGGGNGSGGATPGGQADTSSSVVTRPVAASVDWTKNVLAGLQILLLLGCAAWIGRAVWRVL